MRWIYALFFLTAFNGFGQFEIGETSFVFNDADRDRAIETFVYYPAVEPGENMTVSEGKFPVIVVGHGFLMTYDYYAYLWEHFVPLGYIVVLPNTETDVAVSHNDYGMDLSYVVGAMHMESELESSLFYQHVSALCGMVGHSMGGGAALLATADNAEITTVVTLAAAETDPSAISAASSITQPSLTFAASSDCVTPPADHQELMYNNLSDCKGYVLIAEGSHCQFANSNFVCELGEFSCPETGVTEGEQHDAVLEVMTPWFNAYLKTEYSAWEEVEALEGEQDNYDFELDCTDNAPVLSIVRGEYNETFVYPNPTKGWVSIPEGDQNNSYVIYAADGRKMQQGITKATLDLSYLEKGIYLLQVTSASGDKIVYRIQRI